MPRLIVLAVLLAAVLGLAATHPEEARTVGVKGTRALSEHVFQPIGDQVRYRTTLLRARDGDADSQFGIGILHAGKGRIYGFPEGIERDPVYGAAMMRKAVDGGSLPAQYWWYRNVDSSRVFLEKAAESAPAMWSTFAVRVAADKACGSDQRAELSDSLSMIWTRFESSRAKALKGRDYERRWARKRQDGMRLALVEGGLLADYDARCDAASD